MKYSHSIIKMVYIYLGTNLDGAVYILDSSPLTAEEHRPRKISGVGRRRREVDLRRRSRLRQICLVEDGVYNEIVIEFH